MANTTPIKGHKTADGDLTANKFISTVAIGTAPFTVASTTLVTNFNADLLDGINSSQFLRSDVADIKTAGNLTFNDNVGILFGTGADSTLFYNATDFILFLTSGDFRIKTIGPIDLFTFGRTTGNFTATGQLISSKAQNNGVIFEDSYLFGNVSATTNTTGMSTIALATSSASNYGYSMSANRRGTDGTADMVWHNHHNSSVGIKKMTLTKEGDLIVATGNIQGINRMRKTITDVNAAFTIRASDAGVVRKVTANSFNVTVDTVSLDNIGDTAEVDNFGSGTITIVAGTATLRVNGNDTLVMDGQYSRVAIQKMTTTEYRVFGQLARA